MKEEYDFFAIGKKHAQDSIEEIKRLAMEYEKKYGKQARVDFEYGIASEMSQYMKVKRVEDYVEVSEAKIDPTNVPGGTIKYGAHGTSEPYLPRLDEVEGYDPDFNFNASRRKK